MSTLQNLETLLTDLDDEVSDQIMGSLLASTDGFLIASTLRDDDADRIAAMVATTTGVGRRMADTLEAGALAETTISGEDRLIMLYLIGDQGVLAVVAKTGANVALINMAARNAASEAQGMIRQVTTA
jgi:predicted regulator of Ras-like GTPase activity (Roadblock/LC7/MglB family)